MYIYIHKYIYIYNVYINDQCTLQNILHETGGSITRGKFSVIHGNLFTQFSNKEAKSTAGPFCLGFSGDTDAVNSFKHNSYPYVVHKRLHKCLQMRTGSKHKELTNEDSCSACKKLEAKIVWI